MLWTLNLRHLHAVEATHRLGSVSKAARAISISQPAITQAIAKMEKQLAEPLFERQPNGMVPAPAATLLAPRIAAALSHIASSRVTMTQMRATIAVADAGGYAAASVATGLSQPSLNRALADLSVALRRSLIERRGRGTILTEAGRRVVRGYRLARAELEAGLSEVAALSGRETGRITIGAMPLSRARLLPSALTRFGAAYPMAHLRIIEGAYADLIEPLRNGEIDVLIGAIRDRQPGDDLEQRLLFEDRPVVVGRKGHPIAADPGIAAIAAYSWTVPGAGTPLRSHWERLFTDRGIAIPRVPIECGSAMTIRQILMDTDFLTLLSPDQVTVELEAGWLRIVSTLPADIVRTIGLTMRSGWRPTQLQQAFIAVLEDVATC